MNRQSDRRRRFTSAILIITALLAVSAAVYQLLLDSLLDDLSYSEHNTLELVTSSLRGEIRRFEILGTVLADNKELNEFLSDKASVSLHAINRKLEEINRSTGALDTYLMDTSGTTIAASNWKKDTSFVGNNFSYRPYFQLAIGGQAGNFFAIGTTSLQRGLYIATPVTHFYRPIGVVVIKVRVDHLERLWQAENRELSLLDSNGIIFISTRPEWRLKSIRELKESEIERIIATRQYPNAEKISRLVYKAPDPDSDRDNLAEIQTNQGSEKFLQLSSSMQEANWTVLLHSKITDQKRIALLGTLVIGFGIAGIIIVAYTIYQRLQYQRRRLERAQAYRNKLESAIAKRTRDLQNANAELIETQQKLVQSGRLAAIGRFSAGLSHEISQPLTALHSYISNAQQLLELERYEEADTKLESIAGLADRITLIIRQLKIFVRGDELITAPVSLSGAIDEALGIMQEQADKAGVKITVDLPSGDKYIHGDDILLLQLFVNLISNALDAVTDSDGPHIAIQVYSADNEAIIEVRDNGQGLSESDLPNIFEPFYTTKKTGRGLGLGLTIAQEIVSRFHGEMSARNNRSGGATFKVTAPLYERKAA